MLEVEEGSAQLQSLPTAEKVARYVAWPLAVASVLMFMLQGGLGLLIRLYFRELDSALLLISLAASLAIVGILLGGFLRALSDTLCRKLQLVALLGAGAVGIANLSFLLPPRGMLAGFALSLLGFRLNFIVFAVFPVAAMALVLLLPRQCRVAILDRTNDFSSVRKKEVATLFCDCLESSWSGGRVFAAFRAHGLFGNC